MRRYLLLLCIVSTAQTPAGAALHAKHAAALAAIVGICFTAALLFHRKPQQIPSGRYTLFLTTDNNVLIHTYTFDITAPAAK
jgi:hypothetical protein